MSDYTQVILLYISLLIFFAAIYITIVSYALLNSVRSTPQISGTYFQRLKKRITIIHNENDAVHIILALILTGISVPCLGAVVYGIYFVLNYILF